MFKKFIRTQYIVLAIALNISPLLAQADISVGDNMDSHREHILKLFSGEWISRGIYAAVKLNISDILETGPKSIDELSMIASADTTSLYRLLHLLAGHGIFQEISHGVFANTQASSLLAKNHPHSLYSLCLFYGEDIHQAWDALLPSIQTGTPAFQLTFNQPVFQYFKNNPQRAALFQAAMKDKSQAVISSSLVAYDFSPFNTIYDIGGGQGQFLTALLNDYPNISATLFDLPEVIEKLPEIHHNIVTYSGDFFNEVPYGGDLYILKAVLHDWDDEHAVHILKNCHKAMDNMSRLLIVEVVLQPEDQSLYANSMDLLMLAITGGKERTLSSFEDMLHKAGLSLEKVYSTSTEFSILEVKKIQ